MSDILGKRAKAINIPAPTGVKIKGQITKVGLSEKFENYIDIVIQFPEYKKMSDDGRKEFTKQAFYGIPIDWSPKNKAGRLHLSMTGNLPADNTPVNWTTMLLNKPVECILEDVLDDATGESKGHKIQWIGRPGMTSEGEKTIQDDFSEGDLKPDDEIPEFPTPDY